MTRRSRRLAPRHLLVLPGLALAIYAGMEADRHGLGIAPLLLAGIVPDLTRLLGVGQPHAHGQLAPRAVPLFNALHHPVGPGALVALAAAGILPPVGLVVGLAWLGHIVIGFGIGDRLRTRDGFLRPSLIPQVSARAAKRGHGAEVAP